MNESEIDGARLAIMDSRLQGIAIKMANTLLRTGRSGVLNRAKDFSCCILTPACELLAAAESLPIHVLSGPDLMARSMLEFHPVLRRGDAFLHNSPYHGCSHPADHTILVPVIDDDGIHRATVIAKAHQADIGNATPTTYVGDARDVYNEGALIFPAVRVQRDYQNVEDILRMCTMRIRVAEQWRGDFLAMMGAARIGEAELLAFGAEIGWPTIESFTRRWFDYSERRMDAALRRLPAGTTSAVSRHDAFPGTPPDGVRIRSIVTVRPDEGRITVDLRDNPDCMPNGLNLSEACARTAAMIGVFNSIDHDVPKNAGSMRRIDVLLRDGCIAGRPRHPTSCSAATTNIADRVASSTQRALAELSDGVGMAEAGAIQPPSMAVISGYDPRVKRDFVNQLFLGVTGGAAAPHADAWWQILHVGNAGMSLTDSVELDEASHPIVVHERSIVPDTEGAGRYCGAPSLRVEYGPTHDTLTAVYISDGGKNPALGARGGGTGGRSGQFKRLADGTLEPLPAYAQVKLSPGESIVSISCGGGGYGLPSERDPADVARQVAEGLITIGRASDMYRVAITAGGGPDEETTAKIRAG